jgi:hypothetical protein
MRRELLDARARAETFVEYAFRHEADGSKLTNAPFHLDWHAFLRANQRAVLVAPVEHAKTQHVGIGYTLHRVGSNPNLRCALVSNTGPMAEKLLRSIRTHIEGNQRVREVFPDLRPSQRSGDAWGSTAITVERDTIAKDPTIQACGAHGAIVGSRLDLIVIDDILDVTQSTEVLGKTAGKDQAAEKSTYPAILGLAASRKEAAKLTGAAMAALKPLGKKAAILEQIANHLLLREY